MNFILIFMSFCQAEQLPWWEKHPDSTLQQIIQSGLQDNPDFQAAKARIVQAQTIAAQQKALFLPSVRASWSSNTQPRDALGFGFGLPDLSIPGLPQQEEEEEETSNYYTSTTMALQLNVPLDVWGSSLLNWQAADLDTQAQSLSTNQIQLSLSISVANAYYDLALAKEQKTILTEQIETAKRLLTVIEIRHDRAEASAIDILQQKQQIGNLQATLPSLDQLLEFHRIRLATLLGKSPEQYTSPEAELPMLNQPMKLSLDLVEQRWDVQEAQTRLRASQKREKSAKRALFPQFSLSGQMSQQGNNIQDEWQTLNAWALGSSVQVTLFQGGQQWQNWQTTKANTEIAIQILRKSQLQAQQEITQANIQEASSYQIYLAQKQQVQIARTLYTESEARYTQGLLPLLNVITAQQSYQQAQTNLLQALRDWMTARLQIYFAAGSGDQK